jgi:hypothetical protein
MCMAKNSPTIDVVCPCCHSTLKIDSELAVVLSHSAQQKAGPDVDLTDSVRILAEQARKREDKFRESWESEKMKDDVLTRKFEEGLKKAQSEPVKKPVRDFDLD